MAAARSPTRSRTGRPGWKRAWSTPSDAGRVRPARSSSRSTGCPRPPLLPTRRAAERARHADAPMAESFSTARQVLQRAVAERAFPAATIEVGNTRETLWSEAFGRLTFDADSPPARDDTVFDLASLTKVLATTALVMRQIEKGALGLDDPISQHVPAWPADRASLVITIRDLLSHSSGLPAHEPFFREHRGRAAFEEAICRTPLAYEPRTTSIYS